MKIQTMRNLLAAALCLAISAVHANEVSCLENLQGVFHGGLDDEPTQSQLAIRKAKGSWEFYLPDDSDFKHKKIFANHFAGFPSNGQIILSARVIEQHMLPVVTELMLAPYVEGRSDLQGIGSACGLMTDELFVLRLDLSLAKKEFLEKHRAWQQFFSPSGKSPSMSDVQNIAYFIGERLDLEGVYDGIIGHLMQKD